MVRTPTAMTSRRGHRLHRHGRICTYMRKCRCLCVLRTPRLHDIWRGGRPGYITTAMSSRPGIGRHRLRRHGRKCSCMRKCMCLCALRTRRLHDVWKGGHPGYDHARLSELQLVYRDAHCLHAAAWIRQAHTDGRPAFHISIRVRTQRKVLLA